MQRCYVDKNINDVKVKCSSTNHTHTQTCMRTTTLMLFTHSMVSELIHRVWQAFYWPDAVHSAKPAVSSERSSEWCSLIHVCVLSSLQSADTAGWVTGQESGRTSGDFRPVKRELKATYACIQQCNCALTHAGHTTDTRHSTVTKRVTYLDFFFSVHVR